MKRKVVSTLVTGLVIVALTACGAKTEATNQNPESSEVVESETENVNEETEGNTEDANASAGAENENIVLYAERGSHNYIGLEEDEYELYEGTVTATEDIPLYDGEGYSVGHIKNGSTISITECYSGWARFKNPIAGTDYDYLYVLKDYVTDGDLVALTTTELEAMIKDTLDNRNFDEPVYTSVTDDMEKYEFRIPMYYKPEETEPLYQVYSYFDKAEVSLLSYKTYAVVCTEDTDDYIICQVYYKDIITDEEFNSYRK